jgi:hypothetical protein
MGGTGSPSDPYKAEFDRIAARLNAAGSGSTAEPKSEEPNESARPRKSDIAFAMVWLAIIIALSMLVGGWIGFAVVVAALLVSARLVST